ncbi:hypothetical protein UY3_00178 [Chelonia mydas]|uniref:Uncharacterized protein n=1 Tax=Chelonia mydas TaxID=8469 RepID=M7CMR5_CHEMY|nr:hypothetical protein UY3_00178 [Chelonia mydas]
MPQTSEKRDSCEINRNTTPYHRRLEDFQSCLKRKLCGVETSSADSRYRGLLKRTAALQYRRIGSSLKSAPLTINGFAKRKLC